MRKKRNSFLAVALVASLAALPPAVLRADSEVNTYVLDAGGGQSESVSIRLHGSLGQTAIGEPTIDDSMELRDGFLQTLGSPVPPPGNWSVQLTIVETVGGLTQYRTFGEHGWATIGFDPDFDEIIPPPGFAFYTWLQGSPPFSYLSTSIKPWQEELVSWTLSVWNAGGLDYVISWDPSQIDFLEEGWQLRIDGQDMRQVDQIEHSGNAQLLIEAWYTATSVVEVTLCAEEAEAGAVLLTLQTGCCLDVAGLNAYRCLTAEDPWDYVGYQPLDDSGLWQLEDQSAWPGTNFCYKVHPVDNDGNELPNPLGFAHIRTSGVSEVKLQASRPNPVSHGAVLDFLVPGSTGRTHLAIYDVSGRLVRTLVDKCIPGGRHEVLWDGTDNTGRSVGAGVYLCLLETAGQRDTGKLVRLK